MLPSLAPARFRLTSTITGDTGTQDLVINLAPGESLDLSGLSFSDWTSGTDTIDINGSTGGETIVGTSQSDTIFTGGGGIDVLTGGGGLDTFVYTGADATLQIGGDRAPTVASPGSAGSPTLPPARPQRPASCWDFRRARSAVPLPPTIRLCSCTRARPSSRTRSATALSRSTTARAARALSPWRRCRRHPVLGLRTTGAMPAPRWPSRPPFPE